MKITESLLKQLIEETLAERASYEPEDSFDPLRGVKRLIQHDFNELVRSWNKRAHDIWAYEEDERSLSHATNLGWDIVDRTKSGEMFQGNLDSLVSQTDAISKWIAVQLCKKFGDIPEGYNDCWDMVDK